jgi:hypothetical protein
MFLYHIYIRHKKYYSSVEHGVRAYNINVYAPNFCSDFFDI